MAGIQTFLFDKVAALHKHAAGTAGGIKHNAVIRFDDVDDGLYQGRRGKEFAVIKAFIAAETAIELNEASAPKGELNRGWWSFMLGSILTK